MRTICAFLWSFVIGATVLCAAEAFPASKGEILSQKTRDAWTAYIDAGEVEKAESLFREAIKEQPNSSAAAYGLMAALETRGQLREALSVALTCLPQAAPSPWIEAIVMDLPTLVALRDVSIHPKTGKPTMDIAATLLQTAKAPGHNRLTRIFLTLSAANMARRCGQIQDAIKIYASLPYLRNWSILGPFNNREKAGFDKPLDVEEVLPARDLTKDYPGRSGAVRWTPLHTLLEDGYVNLSALLFPNDENVAYAVTEFESEKDQEATLILGTTGRGTVWVNGVRVCGWKAYELGFNNMKRVLRCPLRKGANQICLKLGSDRTSGLGFSAMLVPFSLDELEMSESLPATWASYAPKSTDATCVRAESPDVDIDDTVGTQWGLAKFLATVEPENGLARAMCGVLAAFYCRDDDQKHLSRKNYEEALKLSPKCTVFYLLSALSQQDKNTAMEQIKKALTIYPGDVMAQETMMGLLLGNGFYRRAEEIAETLLKASNASNTSANLVKAAILMHREQTQESLPYFLRAHKETPGKANLYNQIASMTTGKDAKMAWIKRGLAVTADESLLDVVLEDLMETGKTDPKAFAQAEKLIREHILLLDPWRVDAWEALAACRKAVDDVEGVQAIYREALSWLPANPTILQLEGALALSKEKKAEAVTSWQASLQVQPDNPELRQYMVQIAEKETHFYDPYIISADTFLADLPKASDYPDFSSVSLLDEGVVYQLPNGSKATMYHLARMALRVDGVNDISGHTIAYDPQRERITILNARLHQPDGSIIPAESVSDHSGNGGSGGGRIYSSYTVKSIRFNGAREGSVMEIEYINEPTGESEYGNLFEDIYFFGGTEPTLRFRYVVDTLEEKHVDVKTFKVDDKATFVERRENGRHIREWNARDIPGIRTEPNMPPLDEVIPSFHASHFESWEEVGRWFWDLARDSARLPDDLKKTTHELTKDAKTPEEKIAAIYYAVIDQVRYVGIELGRNGYVPHRVERTWQSKYGDCKDTALLMAAMLREVGVEATVALVRTSDHGIDPTGMPGARVFNHAICYVPPINGKDYWLDGTTDYFHITELTPADAGAMALITSEDGGRLVTIPELNPNDVGEKTDITIDLQADGSGTISLTNAAMGILAPMQRRMFAAPEQFAKQLEFFLKRRYPKASMKDFVNTGSDLRKQESSFSLSVNAPDLGQHVGENIALQPVVFQQYMSRRYASQNERIHDLALSFPYTMTARYVITLPKGSTLVSGLEDIEIDKPFGLLRRKTEMDEAGRMIVTIQTSLRVRRVPVADYQEFRTFCATAEKIEEDQLVLTLPEGDTAATSKETSAKSVLNMAARTADLKNAGATGDAEDLDAE